MKLNARTWVIVVAVVLVALAGAAGLAYWRLQPQPQAAQVLYGSGRIEADEVRVGVETSGRLAEIDGISAFRCA